MANLAKQVSQRPPFEALRRVLLGIVDEACEAISEQQFPAIRFGLGQKLQESVSHVGSDSCRSENSQGLGKIENL